MINQLLNHGFIPYENHSNPLYKALQDEAYIRSGLLTGKSRQLFVVKSRRKNAYIMRRNDDEALIITDSLLLHLQTSSNRILTLDSTRRVFNDLVGYVYEVYLLESPLWHGASPPDTQIHKKFFPHISLLLGVTRSAAMFVILHEISHMLKDNEDVMLGIPINIGETFHETKREYSADVDAAWWIANRVRDALAERNLGSVQRHNLIFNFVQAFLGSMIAILYTSDEGGSGQSGVALNPHPKYDARLELLYWQFQKLWIYGLGVMGDPMIIFDSVINELRKIIERDVFGK